MEQPMGMKMAKLMKRLECAFKAYTFNTRYVLDDDAKDDTKMTTSNN